MSDELVARAPQWPSLVETGRERGHVLRGLRIDPDTVALEIGAGCGAVTRHLAERCAAVDAVELNPSRAAVAASRVRDLDNVRVLVGRAEDVPAEPAYDLIVVVGVLEYVGEGPDTEPRVAWLRRLAAALRPGGHIALAIENRMGATYIAGAADDHSGRLFQTIEDHPHPAPARTYTRQELESLFRGAGLTPRTLGVFPDYRFARFVFDERLTTSAAAPLLWRVPSFPSYPNPTWPLARVIDERRLWRGLCRMGHALDFANSHLVIARVDGEPSLWPSNQLATFFSVGRQRSLMTCSEVIEQDGEITVQRRRLSPDIAPPRPWHQREATLPLYEGEEAIELLAFGPEEEVGPLLRKIVSFIENAAQDANEGETNFDVWPGNLIVMADNELALADVEMTIDHAPTEQIIDRSFLLTAIELARRSVPERWRAETVTELHDELRELAGLGPSDLDATVRRQAVSIADLKIPADAGEAHSAQIEIEERAILETLASPIADNSVFGDARDAEADLLRRHKRRLIEATELQRAAEETAREQQHRAELAEAWIPQVEARAKQAEDSNQLLREQLTSLQGKTSALQAELEQQAGRARSERAARERADQILAEVVGSPSWRVTAPLRRAKRVIGRG